MTLSTSNNEERIKQVVKHVTMAARHLQADDDDDITVFMSPDLINLFADQICVVSAATHQNSFIGLPLQKLCGMKDTVIVGK